MNTFKTFLEEVYKLERTKNFLKLCEKEGYTAISVEMSHTAVPNSVKFCFGPQGSIFAWPEIKSEGWPPIWTLVRKIGFGGSCGNSHQYQIGVGQPILTKGVFILKDGEWDRIA